MSAERYDDGTVQLVAAKLPFVNFDDDDFDEVDLIRRVLDALADAGLLMPPAATRDVYQVIYEGNGPGSRVRWSEHWDRESADGGLRRARSHYPDARMEHRREYETPWTEVTT